MVRERRRRTPEHRPQAAALAAEATLDAFLSRPSQPEGTLSLGEVRGFLFAVVAAPELVKPSEWIPVILGGREPSFESREEAQEVMNALMPLYNETSDQVSGKRGGLPRGCEFREDVLANLEPDAPVSQWARGFLAGHLWLEETWDAYLPDEQKDELAPVLAVLSFFASRAMAEDFAREFKDEDATLESVARTFRRHFPDAAAEYAETGQAIWKAILAAREERPGLTVPETPVGRNDPCPCGSGRKFKRCCGASTH